MQKKWSLSPSSNGSLWLWRAEWQQQEKSDACWALKTCLTTAELTAYLSGEGKIHSESLKLQGSLNIKSNRWSLGYVLGTVSIRLYSEPDTDFNERPESGHSWFFFLLTGKWFLTDSVLEKTRRNIKYKVTSNCWHIVGLQRSVEIIPIWCSTWGDQRAV